MLDFGLDRRLKEMLAAHGRVAERAKPMLGAGKRAPAGLRGAPDA